MAVSVSPELLELRQACDSKDIKWHWRHKESTLEGLIKDCASVMPENTPFEEVAEAAIRAGEMVTPEKRHIPQDVLSALEYCDGYHRGNTKCIRAYIEEILNGTP